MNIYNLAFKDPKFIKKSVLAGLTEQQVQQALDDPVYGLGSSSTLLNWVLAMNDGPQSFLFADIQKHFGFSSAEMNQIVGPKSIMF